MIVRRTVLLFVALFACVLSAPRAPAQPAGGPRIAEVPGAIVDLLGDYARAFREHDEALLEATVGRGLVDREVRALRNAEHVRFTTFEIEPVTQFSGDLASDRIKAKYKGERVSTYHVSEKTRFEGETDTYVEDGAFTFLREEGREGYDGWRLVSKDDLAVLGFFSPYHLWDEDEVAVLRSERFVLLTHPEVTDVMRPVLQVAERAYDRVDEFWPGQQRDRIAIIAPATTPELGRIMHETIDLGKFVAFVSAGSERARGWEPTGPRMFIHLSHLRNYRAEGQQEILAHELIHAVTRDATGPHIPTWVEEGLANFGGGEGARASRATIGPTPNDFPTSDRFVTGPVGGIQVVYDQSQMAIEVLDAAQGRADLARFYSELGKRRVVAGTEGYHVRDVVAVSTGWSYEAWLDAWRRRLG